MGETRGWLRSSWRTVVILLLIIGIAGFLRVYFVAGEALPGGYWSFKGDYSGGSDPFYWERALNYSFLTGKEISWDYAMNYPIGTQDVRPPLFDWFNLLVGYVIAPLFPSAWIAAVFMLIMNAALFGTLTVIPTYLLGKEAFNKRVGLVAALLLAISAASLQRSHATIAVHDAWTLFFVVCAFYFYLRALKTLNRKRWVENWFQRAAIRKGLRDFFQENRKSVLYALLAGMSVAVTALSWQGWAYVPVLLVLIFLVELMLDRIRNQDTLGVTILFLLILATPLLVSFPWYYVRVLIKTWWDVPFYLFMAALVLGIIFTVTRDYPWTIVIPATFLGVGIALGVLATLNPGLLFAFYSGAGYFVKNKVYQTIAEAQEPGMSELILAYGWFTFFIGLAAAGLMIWQTPRRNNPAYTMLVFWLFGALFMALSAARFIFNAAPVFAVATAYGIDLILARMDFAGMRRTYRSLAEGSRRNALRKAVKLRHVLTILFLAFLVLLPNTWFAVDAGIPYDQKTAYDQQINALLPPFLRAPGYGSSSGTFYLGAFGYSLPKASDYFPAGWSWLSTQDTQLPLELRPSFMSWWDYGFEASERGGHPVVADPFQNGYAVAGQFILAQNESSAIGLMASRLLEGDYWGHARRLSPPVTAVLDAFEVPAASVAYAFTYPASLIPVVLSNPSLYGPWDSNMQPQNAQYIYLDHLLTSYLRGDRLVSFYHALQTATGKSIAYFMVDSRLFPISATNTGIFYAPAKLSDHRVIGLQTGQVMPQDFFQVFADTNRGTHLPVQILGPADQIQKETIEYQPMFYNSMFYRSYVGYTPTDLGSPTNTGIPGIDSALQSYPPVPAWNMTHWRVVYRTAYYNPFTDLANHTGAWRAVNYAEAQALQQKIQAGRATGVVDLGTLSSIQNGMVILRYYDGAWVNGTVTVGGVPLPGVWLTVVDELGTPHYLTKTDAQGHYSALAPFGNITLVVSSGNLTRTNLFGQTILGQAGFPVRLNQALRVNEDLNGDGIPDWLITKNIDVTPIAVSGTAFFDTNHNSLYTPGADVVLAGATLTITAKEFPYTVTVTTGATGAYNAGPLTAGTYIATPTYRGHSASGASLFLSRTGSTQQDVMVPFADVTGTVFDPDGVPGAGAEVTLTDALNRSAWSVEADSSGKYSFSPVLTGNYNVTAASGVLGTLPYHVQVSATAPKTNLTLEPMGRVVGTTFLNGARMGNLLLRFQSETNSLTVVAATSDASGAFSVSLPAGSWDVNGRAYEGSNLYGYLGRVVVRAGETASLAASFVSGAMVSGTVVGSGLPQGISATIAFTGSAGTVWARANAGSEYAVFLPLGTYDVEAFGPTSAVFTSLDLEWTRTLDLTLSQATTESGTVYWDRNGNGVADGGEGIAGARIDLRDEQGRRLLVLTNATGVYTLTGLANRTYAGSISADGFASRSLGPTTLAGIGPGARFALEPLAIQVTGRVLLNGTALLNRGVTIRAVPNSTSARPAATTSFSDGSYSLSLVPGAYTLVVDENVSATNASRYQNLRADALTLAVGQCSLTHDLAVAFRVLVTGNVTLNGVPGPANVSFAGPDVANVTVTGTVFRVYLQPGAYSAAATRTVSSVVYGILTNATLPISGNLSLVLRRAISVSGQIRFGAAPVSLAATLTFTRLEGGVYRILTSSAGAYTSYVVPGNYTVSLNASASATSLGTTHYYRYVFEGTLAVSPSPAALSYPIDASRSLDNTTVAGLITLNGAGVDASLSFIAKSGGALNATLATRSDGAYSVGLAPGGYVVHVTRTIGGTAFLGGLTVPHAASLSFGVSLLPGHELSGVTTDAFGARIQTGVTIRGNGTLTVPTDATGAYAALLPAGTYVVSASRAGTDRGLPVTLSATEQVVLTADAVANLQLEKVPAYGVHLAWDASQNRTVSPGSAVTYTVTVSNTGNVPDSFVLGGGTTGWTFTFSPATVPLDYGIGRNATQVSVTIQTPKDALVDHAPVTIAASSTGSTAKDTLTLVVGIERVRALSLTVDLSSGTFDGRYLNYTANLKNLGNAAETVTVGFTNPADVAASGWVPRIAKSGSTPQGTTIPDLSVAANTTVTLRLSLLRSGGGSGATVVLQASATDAAAVVAGTAATLVLPSLAETTGVGVTGPNVAKTLPLNLEIIAIVVGAASAVAVGLFLSGRRR